MHSGVEEPWLRTIATPLVLAAAALFVYWRFLTVPFAASDDYLFLARLLVEGRSVVPLVLPEGRPLHGLSHDLLGGALVHGVPTLWWYRAVFVGTLWLSALWLWRRLQRAGHPEQLAAALALLYLVSLQQVDASSPASEHTVPAAALLPSRGSPPRSGPSPRRGGRAPRGSLQRRR